MDAWGWSSLHPWLAERATLPVGPLFCVIAGPTVGHAWSASAARLQLYTAGAGPRRSVSSPTRLRATGDIDRSKRSTEPDDLAEGLGGPRAHPGPSTPTRGSRVRRLIQAAA